MELGENTMKFLKGAHQDYILKNHLQGPKESILKYVLGFHHITLHADFKEEFGDLPKQ